MEEFIQESKRVARGSGYKGRPLVEEFKRGMNSVIRRKLMEAENQPGSIEQWYKRAMALDRNWRESRREKKRLKVLWQLLITKTNDHTSGKFLKLDIKWEVHKKTQQGVSAKLESYIY